MVNKTKQLLVVKGKFIHALTVAPKHNKLRIGRGKKSCQNHKSSVMILPVGGFALRLVGERLRDALPGSFSGLMVLPYNRITLKSRESRHL